MKKLMVLLLALTMLVATVCAFPGEPFAAHELSFVYAGACVALLISGGMRYSLDRVFFRA